MYLCIRTCTCTGLHVVIHCTYIRTYVHVHMYRFPCCYTLYIHTYICTYMSTYTGVHAAHQPPVSGHGLASGVRDRSLRGSAGCPLPAAGAGQEPHGPGHPLPASLCLQTTPAAH